MRGLHPRREPLTRPRFAVADAKHRRPPLKRTAAGGRLCTLSHKGRGEASQPRSSQRVALRPSSFSPCGRRWRDANTVSSATDEGSASAARTPHPPSLRRSRCKASASPFKKDGGRRPPMHPLPQGERGGVAAQIEPTRRAAPFFLLPLWEKVARCEHREQRDG